MQKFIERYGCNIDKINDFKEQIFKQTSLKFMGYNFSSANEEVCIYKYLPKEDVISVLETLQVELLLFKMLDIDFFKMSKAAQQESTYKLKSQILRAILKTNDYSLLHVYEGLYLNNKNMNSLYNEMNKDLINEKRIKILKIAKSCKNSGIKR